jgi:hypothetical protein
MQFPITTEYPCLSIGSLITLKHNRALEFNEMHFGSIYSAKQCTIRRLSKVGPAVEKLEMSPGNSSFMVRESELIKRRNGVQRRNFASQLSSVASKSGGIY